MTVAAVVVDIEGTTSSLSYVHRHLFPYARRQVGDWVTRPEVAQLVDEARAVAGRPDATPAEVADLLREWIDEDAKVPVLKSLQGLIWAAGFAAGELVAHVYDDVPEALRAWHGKGARVHVYSSGSVLAQQQWFAHTPHGDLTRWLAGYFDTRNAGAKREVASYRAITAAIDSAPERTLFLSDTPAELDAARSAGWRTVQVVRPDEPGAAPAPAHPQVSDLLAVDLDAGQPAGERQRA